MDCCCVKDPETLRVMQIQTTPTIPQRAPSWSGVAMIDLKLQELSSQDFSGRYLVLIFYPCDFSFICPTELIQFSDRVGEFRAIGAEVVAVSTDSEYSHFAWVTTPRKKGGLGEMRIPLLADKSQQITGDYGVLDEKQGTARRALFVVDQEGIIRHATISAEGISRSVDEVLRVVKACCFVDKYGSYACPYGPLQAKNASGEEPNYFGTI